MNTKNNAPHQSDQCGIETIKKKLNNPTCGRNALAPRRGGEVLGLG
jgi:hypothetical protein